MPAVVVLDWVCVRLVLAEWNAADELGSFAGLNANAIKKCNLFSAFLSIHYFK